MTSWNGTPLSQMTSRQLIGVIEEMERKQQGWQDIETAPKDGARIVLLDSNVDQAAVGEWMADVEWMNKGKGTGDWFAQPGWFPLSTPTHWMPLPEAPNAHPKG